MYKNIFVSAAFFLGSMASVAQAQSCFSQDGKSSAASMCMSMSFSSDQDNCMAVVRSAAYFDQNAVPICKGLSFVSDQMTCLGDIKQKSFLSYEITFCSNKSFTSDKLSCLSSSGTVCQNVSPQPPVDLGQIRLEIQDALYSLRNNNPSQTDNDLVDVLNRLSPINR